MKSSVELGLEYCTHCGTVRAIPKDKAVLEMAQHCDRCLAKTMRPFFIDFTQKQFRGFT